MPPAPPRPDIPRLSDLPLEVDTPRARLRPQREDDAEALFPYVSDPLLVPMVTWAAHADVEETRRWLLDGAARLAQGTDIVWTIEHAGAPVGCVGLHGITWGVRAVRFDRAELGYWIARPFWGRGLMTEAATAATRWALETLGLHKVTVMCMEGNVGSRRVIEKVGFRLLGRAAEDVWRDGWHATLRYELTASAWAAAPRV